ncbi:Csu type fimbrial protein [Pseudodonghicola flavimaris]|uniref:Spore coat U domain-containing protein n=1 Tax=Pseudodonghicola flavimaris TaxID=3050036 RepID=A0ABT7EYJ7_9RHOB|nr:spore coat U domain-containing protein [Pseudodonghicola flavimaris]MDK3017345.1 spore coat U domain-containing protein [Pseudodonghicola flavimaris]
MSRKTSAALAILAVALCGYTGPVVAQTATATFGVQIVISDDCEVTSTETLDFGTQGVLTTAVTSSADLQITCTTGTGYSIGLNEGATTGGTTATRLMEVSGGGATIGYELYSDSARTSNWGDTIGTDVVTGTGTGAAQTYTVYGTVPSQTTPAAGTYTDTITVTVTF